MAEVVAGVVAGEAGLPMLPYLSETLADWGDRAHRHRRVHGTLLSADLAGFTSLSERLSTLGRRGSEELTEVINASFDNLITGGTAFGGDIVAFGGDAVLVLFAQAYHARAAAQAAVTMLQGIERQELTTSLGPAKVAVSIGIHSGEFDLFLPVGDQLLVSGPGASQTIYAEIAADRNQIVVTHDCAEHLPPDWLGAAHGPGYVLNASAVPIDLEAVAAAAAARPVHLPPRSPASDQIPAWLEKLTGEEGATTNEHRLVAVAFLRVSGLDNLLIECGPTYVGQKLTELAEIVLAETKRRGTYWLASDIAGDGAKIILTAGAPSSTDADPEALVHTVLAIRDRAPDLEIRFGLNHGLVFAGDLGNVARRTFTVMGDPVNLAARLAYAAGPGEVLASNDVLSDVQDAFDTGEVAPFKVKGKQGEIRASIVRSAGHHAIERAGTVTNLPMLGRDDDFAQLTRLLAAVRIGQGRTVAIAGPTGIGKTRLVSELVRLAPDLRLVGATARAFDSSTPYAGLRDVLRVAVGLEPDAPRADAGAQLLTWVEERLPDLCVWAGLLAQPFDAAIEKSNAVERLAPAFQVPRVHASVSDVLIESLAGPTLIWLDGVQNLDEASVQFIESLLPQVSRRPWLLVLSGSADAAIMQAPVDERMDLGPLDDAAARLLLTDHVGLKDLSERDLSAITSAADGNPLFLLELGMAVHAGTMGDEPPRSLERLVTARIDRLQGVQRRVLREVSALGEQFDVTLLSEVLDITVGDLDLDDPDGLGAFLDADEDHVSFRFEVYRDVAYAGLPYRRRREVHLRAADALEARGLDDVETTGRLSYHSAAAGDAPRAWRYAVGAADEARRAHANADAVELYQRAIEQLEHLEVPPLEVARVAESLGDAADIAAELAVADTAFALASEHRDQPSDRARLVRKRAQLFERRGDLAAALTTYGEARELLGDADPLELARIATGEANVAIEQGRYDEGIAAAAEAAAVAAAAGDGILEGLALMLQGMASVFTGSGDVHGMLRTALDRFVVAGDLELQARAHDRLGMAAFYLRRWPDALEAHRNSQRCSDAIGDVQGAARSRFRQAMILTDQGRLSEAEVLLERALRTFRQSGPSNLVGAATGLLGLLRARQGRAREALDLIDVNTPVLYEHGADTSGQLGASRVECLARAGRYSEAIAEADALLVRVGAGARAWLCSWVLRSKGCAELVFVGCEQAIATLHEARVLAEDPTAGDYQRGLALLALVRAGEVCGDADLVAGEAEARAILAPFGVTAELSLPLP